MQGIIASANIHGMSTVALIDNFIANIEAGMHRHGWTQRELARQSGVHYVTINRILKRQMDPTMDTCERLAGALELHPEIIFRNPVDAS